METTEGEVTDREAPLLLISRGNWFHKYLIYSLSENRLSHLNIPELPGWIVVVTSYGWLVLIEPELKECCLFNLKSKDKIQLPQLQELFYACILTKRPTEPDCYVVFINYCDLCFCRIGGDEFTTVPFGFCGSIVSFQGQIYGFCRARGIVTIHFVGKTIEFRPVQIEMMHSEPKPWFRLLNYHTWLIESCGEGEGEGEAELLMVHKMFLTTVRNGINFRVCRVDPVRRSCEELVNIGDRTIFLSYCGGGYCCRPASGIKPNSIYYLDESCDRNFHVFNLENCSVTSMPFPPRSVRRGALTAWVDKKTLFS